MTEFRGALKTFLITEDAYLGIVDLARLDPSDPDLEVQRDILRKILEQFRVLTGVELDSDDSQSTRSGAELTLRDDNVLKWSTLTEILECSNNLIDGWFRVPKINDSLSESN